ncbi:MAG: glycosyltransferase family 2 protein [Planctomycetota bacterium]
MTRTTPNAAGDVPGGTAPADAGRPVELSLVVPVFDEEENLPVLHREIAEHVGSMGLPWEVVYVDDRSRDRSFEVLLDLHEADEHVRIIRFRRNFGQTPAMSAGFEHSRGRIVVTLDADLQNDPADIPALVERLEQGYDIVVGWRKNRQDGFVLRKIPSRIANRIIARVTGATVHDTGCTLKAFRRELVENLPIYAEQHRFLPVLALASGARISELVVNHRPRIHGVSKYGIGRAVRVALDILTMKMLSSFAKSPLQYFVLLSIPFVLAPLLYLVVASFGDDSLTFGTGWGQAAILTLGLMAMAGVYFVLLGLLAELVVKVFRRSDRPLSSRSDPDAIPMKPALQGGETA